ncbi:MAG: hypothetical protein ACTSRW_02225 [Candidatus Helarchaeota archaeon]
MSEKGGSWFFGIIMILAGALLVVLGIAGPIVGPILAIIPGFQTVATKIINTFSSGAAGMITKGGMAVVSGIGLIKDEEWALGMAILLLVLVVVDSISYTISWAITAALAMMALNPFGAIDPLGILNVILFIVGVVGIVYLILTRERYS